MSSNKYGGSASRYGSCSYFGPQISHRVIDGNLNISSRLLRSGRNTQGQLQGSNGTYNGFSDGRWTARTLNVSLGNAVGSPFFGTYTSVPIPALNSFLATLATQEPFYDGWFAGGDIFAQVVPGGIIQNIVDPNENRLIVQPRPGYPQLPPITPPITTRIVFSRKDEAFHNVEQIRLKGYGIYANQTIGMESAACLMLPLDDVNFNYPLNSYTRRDNRYYPYISNRCLYTPTKIDSYGTISSSTPIVPCSPQGNLYMKPFFTWEPYIDVTERQLYGPGRIEATIVEEANTIYGASSSLVDIFNTNADDFTIPWNRMSADGYFQSPPRWNIPGWTISSTVKLIYPSTLAMANSSTDPNIRSEWGNVLAFGNLTHYYRLHFFLRYMPNSAPRPGIDFFDAAYTIEITPNTCSSPEPTAVNSSLAYEELY